MKWLTLISQQIEGIRLRIDSGQCNKRNEELEVPQDTDGTVLVSLLWIAVVYWWIYRRLDVLSAFRHPNRILPKDDLATPAIVASAVSASVYAGASETLEDTISEILCRERHTSIDEFFSRAIATYETIVTAFNAGDQETLRPLVAPDVFDAFSTAIAAREAQDMSADVVFLRIEAPEVLDGLIDRDHMEMSIRFVSESFNLPRNRADDAPDGSAIACRTVDIWTFERASFPARARWRVTATHEDI